MGAKKQTASDKIKGYIEVQISGVVYPLKFGQNALCLLDELIGEFNIKDLHRPRHFRALVFCAMMNGAEYKKQEFNLDIIQVGELMDEMTAEDGTDILRAFFYSMPQKTTESTKKK